MTTIKTYKNILLGQKTFYKDWLDSINRINKPNIFIHDFSDPNVNNFIRTNDIDYIIPLHIDDYIIIKQNKLIDQKKILHPTTQTFDLLNDKIKFTEYMLREFPKYIPEVYYINNISLVDNTDIKYPIISKPRYSMSGINMKIYHTPESFAESTKSANDKLLIQKFITHNYEYGAFFLCVNGQIINSKIIRSKYKKFHIKKSPFDKNKSEFVEFDIRPFERIVYDLKYSGGLNIDFKFDDVSNRIDIFEINPRFGGSAFTNNFIYELLCVSNKNDTFGTVLCESNLLLK